MNTEGLHSCIKSCVYLLTQAQIKVSSNSFKTKQVSLRSLVIFFFCGIKKQELFRPSDQRCVYRRSGVDGGRVKHGRGSVMVWGCFDSSGRTKAARCGGRDGFSQVSGNPGRKSLYILEEVKALNSLDLQTVP